MSWINEMQKDLEVSNERKSQYIVLGERTNVFIDLKRAPERRDVDFSEGARTYWDYAARAEGQEGTVLSATTYLHRVIIKELSQITAQSPSDASVEIRKRKKDNGRTEWEVFLKKWN